MSDIKHTITEEVFERLYDLTASGYRLTSPEFRRDLLSIGIAVEAPPRATVTRDELRAASHGWSISSQQYIEQLLTRLNIRVTP